MRQARAPAGQPSPPARAQLDRLEHWWAAHFVGALPAEPPAPVVNLARRLQDRLAASGFASDLKPFRPHVTVVRKVSRPGRIEQIHSVAWSFTELALIESRTLAEGALYSVVESYPLCGGTKTANNSETP
jgi:2'-5' RNA ligase